MCTTSPDAVPGAACLAGVFVTPAARRFRGLPRDATLDGAASSVHVHCASIVSDHGAILALRLWCPFGDGIFDQPSSFTRFKIIMEFSSITVCSCTIVIIVIPRSEANKASSRLLQ